MHSKVRFSFAMAVGCGSTILISIGSPHCGQGTDVAVMDGDDWTSLSINSPSAPDRRPTTEIYAPTKVGEPSSPLAVTGNTDYCAVVASNLTDRAPMHSGNPLATIRSWQISSAASERHLNAARFVRSA